MSRLLTQGTTDFLRANRAPVASYPCTIALRVKRNGGTNASGWAFATIGNLAGSARYQLGLNSSSVPVALSANSSNTTASATALSALVDGAWTTIAGVFLSDTYRALYVDGVFADDDTTSIVAAPETHTGMTLGTRYVSSVASLNPAATIGEVAVWSSGLSALAMLQAHRLGDFSRTQRETLQLHMPGDGTPYGQQVYAGPSRSRGVVFFPSGVSRSIGDAPLQHLQRPQRFRPPLVVLTGEPSAAGITGTLAATESGSDTAAFNGDVIVEGALAATESGADTAAFLGSGTTPAITGTLAATEVGADIAALTGVVRISGALSATESGNDTAAFVSGAGTTQPILIRVADASATIRVADASTTIRIAAAA